MLLITNFRFKSQGGRRQTYCIYSTVCHGFSIQPFRWERERERRTHPFWGGRGRGGQWVHSIHSCAVATPRIEPFTVQTCLCNMCHAYSVYTSCQVWRNMCGPTFTSFVIVQVSLQCSIPAAHKGTKSGGGHTPPTTSQTEIVQRIGLHYAVFTTV